MHFTAFIVRSAGNLRLWDTAKAFSIVTEDGFSTKHGVKPPPSALTPAPAARPRATSKETAGGSGGGGFFDRMGSMQAYMAEQSRLLEMQFVDKMKTRREDNVEANERIARLEASHASIPALQERMSAWEQTLQMQIQEIQMQRDQIESLKSDNETLQSQIETQEELAQARAQAQGEQLELENSELKAQVKMGVRLMEQVNTCIHV